MNDDELSEIPPVVHEVLRSPGQSLDKETRAFFEPRFGHDFSSISVQATSAQAGPAMESCSLRSGPTRCPFGGACHTCLPRLQTKLIINQPGDEFELEADRVAEQVLQMPEPVASKLPDTAANPERLRCEENQESVQRFSFRPSSISVHTAPVPPIVHEVLRSPGRPLEPETFVFFRSRLCHDFKDVRIHSDEIAAKSALVMKARAFTVGRDVVFGEGQYSPQTRDGQRLLGHELTHVMQQSGVVGLGVNKLVRLHRGPEHFLQRATDCSLEHIEKECNTAGARCASIQESYCNKKYPKTEDIEELYKNAVKGANEKKKDYPHAADNLLHFLSGSGAEKIMPVDIFKEHKATKTKLEDEHRNKFIDGTKKRIKAGKLKPGNTVEMVWTGTANAFSFFRKDDLGLAVGGYTLCSRVNVSLIEKSKGSFVISFPKWIVQAFDCYNWDPGKGIGLPGANDNDLCCLQNAGRGKNFRIRTNPWDNTHGPSIAEETVTA